MVSEQLGGESESGDEGVRVIVSRPPAAGDGATVPATVAASVGVEREPTTRRRMVRPENLDGVAIPGGKAHTLRRFVYDVYEQCPHLGPADVRAVARYGALSLRFMRGERRLRELGDLTLAGDPRKLVAEQRALSGELSRLERDLGITIGARAALGVSVGQMKRQDAAARAQRLRRGDA